MLSCCWRGRPHAFLMVASRNSPNISVSTHAYFWNVLRDKLLYVNTKRRFLHLSEQVSVSFRTHLRHKDSLNHVTSRGCISMLCATVRPDASIQGLEQQDLTLGPSLAGKR
ncbi:hypothetical protein E2C01_058882 [Portunus trituberculatus]|uniref:Uncharacterized protein n=1 Tax=Portunus trituberculatus TaxID=210409 RepID=A0A5B7GWQ3_PORTR|nr:hypothetical protein [Portunus trituberculatus]